MTYLVRLARDYYSEDYDLFGDGGEWGALQDFLLDHGEVVAARGLITDIDVLFARLHDDRGVSEYIRSTGISFLPSGSASNYADWLREIRRRVTDYVDEKSSADDRPSRNESETR